MAADDQDQKNKETLERQRGLARTDREDEDVDLARTVIEKRIDAILSAMVNGEWITGVSHAQFAELFDVGLKSIEIYAAEASRIIRRYYREDKDARAEYLARHCQSMERLAQKAEALGSKRGYRDAIEAVKTLAQLQGVLKTSFEVDIEDQRLRQFDGWTRDEKEHFVVTGERPARLRSDDVEAP